MRISGFEWDSGNDPKAFKHGVTRVDIEALFRSAPYVAPDPAHSDLEERFRAIGRTEAGRYVFVVYTLRVRRLGLYIRPISARFMHKKEISAYEKAISEIENGS